MIIISHDICMLYLLKQIYLILLIFLYDTAFKSQLFYGYSSAWLNFNGLIHPSKCTLSQNIMP